MNDPFDRIEGVLYALAAALALSAVGTWAIWTPTTQLKDCVPVVALSIGIVSIAWTAYNHMHQHELTNLQIEQLAAQLKQFNAWRMITDLEKYSHMRLIVREFMIERLNEVLLSHGREPLSKLTAFRYIEGIDEIIASSSHGAANPLSPMHKALLELINSLENAERIKRDYFVHDEISTTYNFVRERWPDESAELQS